jgi:hypothetical protein
LAKTAMSSLGHQLRYLLQPMTGPCRSGQTSAGGGHGPQKRFSVCGLVKRGCDLSVWGHGSLRGCCRRTCPRFMMVFSDGLSPMSFAGYAAMAQPFLRDQSTSVPLGLRFPPVQREFSSGSGLLCPLIIQIETSLSDTSNLA